MFIYKTATWELFINWVGEIISSISKTNEISFQER
ncbi:hypothetical protein EV194_11835 [Natronoflexus pectinivorans]|uniref:Uncharacterized protein n=1 Tax=Natronoflexus pectinivorans TaxID=682526 RepID=A0A4R2G9F9_9BACT|nr:hypothetical protein EV194_11835 [Natronoflexus pectinivorans]